MLYNHTLPPNGGVILCLPACTRLMKSHPDRMKVYLDGLTALHIGVLTFSVKEHQAIPGCLRHPESGRKLYVNKVFTMRINELSEREKQAVLNFYSSAVQVGAVFAGRRTR